MLPGHSDVAAWARARSGVDMSFTPADIIGDARHILNDTDTVSPRQADSELLIWVNDGIREIAMHKPMEFAAVTTVACVAGKCEQTLSFTDSIQLIEVLRVTGGNSLTPFDRQTMDQFRPGWRSDSAGAAQQWSVLKDESLAFLIYPPAPNLQSVDVRHVRNPATLALTDPITVLPSAYKAALIDYVVYRAELKDDENVVTARSTAMFQAFLTKIGVSDGRTEG